MNDFTKEDLHCLHNAIDIQLKTVPMSKLNVQRRRELLEKLQSMIDNYCEHKNDKVIWDVNGVICADCDQPLGII